MFIRLEMAKENWMRNSNMTNITGRERRSRGFKTEEKQGIMKVVYKEKGKYHKSNIEWLNFGYK